MNGGAIIPILTSKAPDVSEGAHSPMCTARFAYFSLSPGPRPCPCHAGSTLAQKTFPATIVACICDSPAKRPSGRGIGFASTSDCSRVLLSCPNAKAPMAHVDIAHGNVIVTVQPQISRYGQQPRRSGIAGETRACAQNSDAHQHFDHPQQHA